MPITVPEAFAEVLTEEAEGSEQWLTALPGLVERYLERWGLAVDGTVMHGNCAVVVPVRRGGEPAVLKVTWPHEEAEHEALALSVWDGAGAVRLLAHDPTGWAMLLERLDLTTSLLDVPLTEAVAVAGEMVRVLDRPAPPVIGTVAATADRWVREFPELLHERSFRAPGEPPISSLVAGTDNDGAVPAELVDQAVAYCRELGPRSANRLVNQDLHYANVLRASRAPWLLIDPKPIAGDPEFGLIPLLWNRFGESTPDRRLADLAAAAGLDPVLARRWAFVRAVDGWLDCGEEDWLGATCARIATILA